MALTFNLRHLEKHSLHLTGDLSAEELELKGLDEVVEVVQPVKYDLEAERLSDDVLVRGSLQCTLNCRCVRCLKPFTQELILDDWTCDLPLEGEDQVEVNNDCIDLTPYVREDILLAIPQHPLCDSDCRGLERHDDRRNGPASVDQQATGTSSAWAELNKLKF